MRYFLDTGILLRLLDRNDPQHVVTREAVRIVQARTRMIVTATQNMAEFWNVCTRPTTARGGLGLDTQTVCRRLRVLERFIVVLKESPSVYQKWKILVATLNIQGKQVHDARLVAMMKAHRIKRILTLNGADFKRYPGIEPLAPIDILDAKFAV